MVLWQHPIILQKTVTKKQIALAIYISCRGVVATERGNGSENFSALFHSRERGNSSENCPALFPFQKSRAFSLELFFGNFIGAISAYYSLFVPSWSRYSSLLTYGQETHPKRNTRQNKSTVCANYFGTVCTNVPLFPFK